MICIKEFQIHNTQSTQRTTRGPQSFYWRKDNKNVHQPLCIDYPKVTTGIRKLSAITYIKWIEIIPHCNHRYSYARHISCVLRSEHSIRQDKTSKGKDSIHHNKCREGRNNIWSIYINKAHDTSRSWHLKIMREREKEIKHIATGTNPQPQGWTTPCSSWWLIHLQRIYKFWLFHAIILSILDV